VIVTLGLLAAVHLQGATSAPRYKEITESIDYQDPAVSSLPPSRLCCLDLKADFACQPGVQDSSPAGVRKTSGTPPHGHLFELECLVSDDTPDCGRKDEAKWGQQFSCSTVRNCRLAPARGSSFPPVRYMLIMSMRGQARLSRYEV
jgi:hypothetical protein